MNKTSEIQRVVITGPESTGKTELTVALSDYYNTSYVPEYAREYISKLSRNYNFNDIENIARKQIELSELQFKKANRILFYDTYLIITKVWFQWVYNDCPEWLINEIEKLKTDLFLLCNNDIPWIPDPVRENGGINRKKLFEIYKSELINYGFNYEIVSGKGVTRFENAKFFVDKLVMKK